MPTEQDNYVRRIIVIDDNPAIHQDFRKILCADSAAQSDELRAMAAALFSAQQQAPAATRQQRLVYELDSADQGQEGLAKVQAALAEGRPYQVAFVDIRMPPGWDGIETIEQLWRVDPNLQTVICSAYSDYSWADIRARLGDSDRLLILKKPFDTAEISQLAAALTEKYRLVHIARIRMDELETMVSSRTIDLKRMNEQLQDEVEQRRRAEECLRHDVLHDRLTGLPNRELLINRVERSIQWQERQPDFHFAVLFMDVDDFKVVNDSLGHEAGDKLLIEIGRRLSAAVRSVDLLSRYTESVTSRLGGDEFVVLLDGLSTPQDAEQVAQRISRVMAEPFELDGHEVVGNLSIGIATSGPRYTRAVDILRDADTAMYCAKAKGKHGYAVFDTTMHSEAKDRLRLEVDLRKAVGTDQFFMHYQPILSLGTGDIVGLEALLRWNHPEHGLIPPNRFIPVAEATGLIMPLGLQVLHQVCRQIMQWRSQIPGKRDLWVSVNLSGVQLKSPDLPSQIEKVIEEMGVDRDALRLEITESVLMQQGDAALATVAKLHERGILLAMDDFGTGYSSLSHLHQLPITCLKVDQSFVQKLTIDGRSYTATVQAIVMLAHNCGFSVIAEGVETQAQLVQLQTLNCDYAQGFHLSRPVPADAIPDLLQRSVLASIRQAYLEAG